MLLNKQLLHIKVGVPATPGLCNGLAATASLLHTLALKTDRISVPIRP